MSRTRLHWFWRAAIAMVAACIYAAVSVFALNTLHESVANGITTLLGGQFSALPWQAGVGVAVGWFLPVLLIAFGVYGLLTWRFGPRTPLDGETRCRKCDYILKGITEPRCSECGERI